MKYQIVVMYKGEVFVSASIDDAPDAILREIKEGLTASLTFLAIGGGFYVFPKGVLDQSVIYLRPFGES